MSFRILSSDTESGHVRSQCDNSLPPLFRIFSFFIHFYYNRSVFILYFMVYCVGTHAVLLFLYFIDNGVL